MREASLETQSPPDRLTGQAGFTRSDSRIYDNNAEGAAMNSVSYRVVPWRWRDHRRLDMLAECRSASGGTVIRRGRELDE